MALSVAYGAVLRASEVVSLKVSDIDSDRKVIRVEQGTPDLAMTSAMWRLADLSGGPVVGPLLTKFRPLSSI